MAFNDLLLQALHKEKTKRPPIWLMRQAGRYMPEYMEIRKKVSFLELCKTPELACEVTLQPVDILGVDAAILFSDILIPIEPIGINLNFNPAPCISNPVRTLKDAENLRKFNPEADAPFLYKTIDLLVKKLNVPLIGFSGAPFTLACYITEGGGSKSFLEIRKMMMNEPETYRILMEKITDDTVKYLLKQAEHGCSALQMFDTWAGILPPSEYEEMVFPYVKRIAESVKKTPFIYFAKDAAAYFNIIKELDCAAVGLDWKIGIKEADEMLGHKFTLQGNLDPVVLFSNKDFIKKHAEKIIADGKNAKGHIFNLGHGIMPQTPVENVRYLVDTVKESI